MNTHDYNNEFALPILSNFRCIFPKEEKKVKGKPKMSHEKFRKLPYLDVKVVKKEPKYFITGMVGDRLVGMFTRNGKTCSEVISNKPKKGNWINGENLDKIKFPVPVSYVSHTGKKSYALLLKDKENGEYKYRLLRMSQDNGESIFLANDSLKHLIRKWDIHILKGRIVLFEEAIK